MLFVILSAIGFALIENIVYLISDPSIGLAIGRNLTTVIMHIVFTGGEPLTTNNRMELLAVIEVLKYLQERYAPAHNIHFYVDSKYVQEGVERLK